MTNAKSMVAGKSFAQRADKVRLSEQLFTALSLANCPLSLGECFTAIRGGNKFVLGNKANTVILTARVVNNGNSPRARRSSRNLRSQPASLFLSAKFKISLSTTESGSSVRRRDKRKIDIRVVEERSLSRQRVVDKVRLSLGERKSAASCIELFTRTRVVFARESASEFNFSISIIFQFRPFRARPNNRRASLCSCSPWCNLPPADVRI